MGTSNKIRRIVRLRQMLKRWRKNASCASANRVSPIPSDVPPGHVAVVVGRSRQRFVVRATYLNHPIFKRLLVQAEEEYGLQGGNGPLAIPCDESVFEEILRAVTAKTTGQFEDSRRCGHPGLGLKRDCGSESQPLLGAGGGFEKKKMVCQATRIEDSSCMINYWIF